VHSEILKYLFFPISLTPALALKAVPPEAIEVPVAS